MSTLSRRLDAITRHLADAPAAPRALIVRWGDSDALAQHEASAWARARVEPRPQFLTVRFEEAG